VRCTRMPQATRSSLRTCFLASRQLFGSPERCRRKGSKKTNGPPGIRDRAMVLFKFCAVCDTPFISTRCDAKFCSSACRQACYRARKATKATQARRAADFAAALIR
jgi:predicted nucleic acid-binding Zn ribbon protein